MNLSELINFFPLKSSENCRFSDDFREIEVNQSAYMRLTSEAKFGCDPSAEMR